MFNGKMKAVTFSYDDGVTQDQRLVEIFNKYKLKATFNLNSELLGNHNTFPLENGGILLHNKNKKEDVKHIYEGHEVAAHTLTHPLLPACEDEEIIRQVEQDRLNLSELVGYEVVGMAYPCGGENNNDHVAEVIQKNTGIQYVRTITSSNSFDLQANLYRFNPTIHHLIPFDELFAVGEKFLRLQPTQPQVFYIWGHSYEFDIDNTWDRFEEFCAFISNKEDIFYGTNKEILLPPK